MNELVAVNPRTGEVLDLAEAGEHELVEALAQFSEARQEIKDYEEAVEGEILRRMDQQASWKLREGGWEVSAPSPTAGTTEYLPDALVEVLRDLVEEAKLIGWPAAAAAISRQLHLRFEVPLQADLSELNEAAGDIRISLTGIPLKFVGSQTHVKPSLAGIRALEKVPGCKEALEAASVAVSPPRRKVKVSRKR